MNVEAAVLRMTDGPFCIEPLQIDAPRADEILVRVVATGMCHTDHEVVHGHMPPAAPAVLGHEGAGVVEAVGAAVTRLVPGDHVVLSFPSCGTCPACQSGTPVRCDRIVALSISGARADGSPTLRDAQGCPVHGCYFGQSSFATRALARANDAVKVRKDAPLELLGPLGCGVQTGAGTVLNTLKPSPGSSIAVFGAGAVGLSAVMAAKIAGCGTVVVVDRVASRLALALELGATHVVNADRQDALTEIQKLGGVDHSVEASGHPRAVEAAIMALKPHGVCALLGVAAPGTKITLEHSHLLFLRTVVGVMQGDANPQTFIPKLVDYFLEGRLPVDRLSRLYELKDINQALRDSASGAVIKPIIRLAARP